MPPVPPVPPESPESPAPPAPQARAVTSASVISRAAPRAEFTEPFRSRVAAITGAARGVLTVAINAFRPLTLEYP